MLAMNTLRDVPEELANRMMVAHGSRMLLRALRGEPEPNERRPHTRSALDRPKPKTRRYVPVPSRPAMAAPKPVQAILFAVADAFKIDVEDLQGPSRSRYLIFARSVAYRLIRDRLNSEGEPRYSLPRIAAFVSRDHSTISHSLSNFDNYCRYNPEVADVYARLSAEAASAA